MPNAIAMRLGDAWPMLEALGFQTYLGGGSQFLWTWLWIGFLLPLTLIMPNTQQIMRDTKPALHVPSPEVQEEIRPVPILHRILIWKPTLVWAMILGIGAATGVLEMTRVSEFLYFQF